MPFSSRRFVEMSGEGGHVLAQASEGWLRLDGLQQGGAELAQQTPRAGPGQAAVAERGESSKPSSNGSSNRIISRCAST